MLLVLSHVLLSRFLSFNLAGLIICYDQEALLLLEQSGVSNMQASTFVVKLWRIWSDPPHTRCESGSPASQHRMFLGAVAPIMAPHVHGIGLPLLAFFMLIGRCMTTRLLSHQVLVIMMCAEL